MATPAPPIPTSDLWLGQWLEAVLARAVAVLGADAPKRQYVSAGEPVPDCDQLTVHLSQIRPTGGGHAIMPRSTFLSDASLAWVPAADFAVTLWRCVTSMSPDGTIPQPQALHADGLEMAKLGQKLWYGLADDSIDGTLWPLQNKPVVLWRSLTQVAPQAGVAAWKMTGEVSLT